MATATDTPRQRYARGEGERLRTDLLDAAADLMAETGTVEGTSLRAVARRVGVSPTAVYKHFEDHDDLLRSTVDHCWTNFGAALVAASHDPDPFLRFAAMGRAYVTFAFDHPGQYHVMFSNRIDIAGTKLVVGESAFGLLVDLVAEMLRELGDDRDPHFVATQVHTWIHGIVDLVCRHPDADWPSVDDLLDGLRERLGLERPG